MKAINMHTCIKCYKTSFGEEQLPGDTVACMCTVEFKCRPSFFSYSFNSSDFQLKHFPTECHFLLDFILDSPCFLVISCTQGVPQKMFFSSRYITAVVFCSTECLIPAGPFPSLVEVQFLSRWWVWIWISQVNPNGRCEYN